MSAYRYETCNGGEQSFLIKCLWRFIKIEKQEEMNQRKWNWMLLNIWPGTHMLPSGVQKGYNVGEDGDIELDNVELAAV